MSNQSSPTLNGKASVSSSAELAMLERVMTTMAQMQQENLREVRGMVMDILQGREIPMTSSNGTSVTEELEEAVRLRNSKFDPPDYDAPGTEDLPEGIAGVWERHDQEEIEFRTSKSPGELLSEQLERARTAAGLDPQGPGSVPSFSTESLGLQWPGHPQS
ncbi:MAG: hypothetical protein WBS24_03460 [Terriglobales bacterium]